MIRASSPRRSPPPASPRSPNHPPHPPLPRATPPEPSSSSRKHRHRRPRRARARIPARRARRRVVPSRPVPSHEKVRVSPFALGSPRSRRPRPLSRASIAHPDVYVRGDVSSRSRAVSRVREDRAHDSDGDYEFPRAPAAATRRRVSASAMSTARAETRFRDRSPRARLDERRRRRIARRRRRTRAKSAFTLSTRDDDDDAMREGDAERGREKGRQVHSPPASVGKVARRDDADDADDVAAANPPPPRKARGVGAGGWMAAIARGGGIRGGLRVFRIGRAQRAREGEQFHAR